MVFFKKLSNYVSSPFEEIVSLISTDFPFVE